MALGINVYQSQHPLDSAKTFDAYPYSKNLALQIQPGVTLRCSSIYKYNEQAGDIEVQLFDWSGDNSVVLYGIYDPTALPGEDGGFEITPVEAPTETNGMARQSTINGCELAISPEHELVSDMSGSPCIRLKVTLTNTTEEPVNFSDDFRAFAYQDGVELPVCMSVAESTLEDTNAWQDIAGGGSVTIGLVYSLRTQSPVELEITGGETTIGAKYVVG